MANAGVSDEKIIGKLSENLCQALPKTLGEMGITGDYALAVCNSYPPYYLLHIAM